MKKLRKFILILCLGLGLSINVYSITAWRNGAGENSILGSESAADIDSVSYNNIIKPLDTLLANFREGCKIAYLSASTITVQAGEVAVSNSGGTIRLMLQNTSSTTASFTDLDTGAESGSQTYYIFAYQETVADSDFDVCISTSSSAPSGKTYYAKLGQFYNDSSSNIDQDKIRNDNIWVERGSVITTSLKTATGAVSQTDSVSSMLTLPGGTYGFYPQLKCNIVNANSGANLKHYTGSGSISSTYTTRISLQTQGSGGMTMYAQQRYITASGIDHWIYLLTDKSTKEIVSAYEALDHPSYGNSGDPDKVPHPFPDYDSSIHKIILVEKENVQLLKEESKEKEIPLLELINEYYKVDWSTVEKYVPLHSGRFLNQKPVLIYEIPNYIKVKKLQPLTNQERVSREDEMEASRIIVEKKTKEDKLIGKRMRKIAREQLVAEGLIK